MINYRFKNLLKELPFQVDQKMGSSPGTAQGHAEAAVSSHMDVHIGPDGPQPPRQIPQISVHPEGRRTGAMPQPQQKHHVVLVAGDNDRQVLIVLIIIFKYDKLMIDMCGIVKARVSRSKW